jgi:hypothetical protein
LPLAKIAFRTKNPPQMKFARQGFWFEKFSRRETLFFVRAPAASGNGSATERSEGANSSERMGQRPKGSQFIGALGIQKKETHMRK